MIGTGYPYDGFEEMYPAADPTPSWYGFGHKHLVFQQTPVRHLILVDGQEHSQIVVEDPDEPLDNVVADRLKTQPTEMAHLPTSSVLVLDRTARPGARPGMESGQFQSPDTRPAVILHAMFGRQVK
jgi:hypothetical protein